MIIGTGCFDGTKLVNQIACKGFFLQNSVLWTGIYLR